MKKEFDFDRDGYTGDAVINRGYDIYDDWVENSVPSRKIVAQVESAVETFQKNGKKSAAAYALACLFALDTRIKEKYNNIWRCLFSYFSWRRETLAFKLLKDALKIPNNESDIRTVIEIELERIRERLDTQEADEDDDETHGGKRNGKSQDQASETQKDQEDEITEDADKKSSDSEEVQDEASEEKTEETSTRSPEENEIIEIKDNGEVADTTQEEIDISQKEERELPSKQSQNESEEEINLFEENSEQTINKTEKNKTNDANSFPLINGLEEEKSETNELSFIDEVIIDNMIKGEEDYVRHNPLDDVRQSGAAGAYENGNDLMNNAEKDAHIYDEMVLGDRDSLTQQIENTSNHDGLQEQTSTQNTTHINQQEQVQDNGNIEAVKQDFENFRMPIAVDISNDLENQMRIDITNSLSDEAKIEMVRLQMEAAREQIEIASADLGFDAPVDNTGVQEAPSIDPPVSQQYRK